MFSQILDCPTCGERFRYEYDEEIPEIIRCPKCGNSHPFGDFSALVLCRQCRTKLSVPLDILNDPDLSCPNCGAGISGSDDLLSTASGDVLSTFDEGGADRRKIFKRMLQDGEIFDKYKIIRLLGRGGMADVYLAEHLLLKQPCALKLMRNGYDSGDPIYVKRFIREARLARQFNHPNIVKVYDAGSDFKTGYLYIAMEYVNGKNLLELLKEGKLSEAVLTDVLTSMAKALKVLHDANIVHRDIKPSNIMLTDSGVYKLMDLGIAKSETDQQQGEMTLTMDQAAIGTPGYASPEQCRSAHQVDTRSDIYCLGATLYHLASGVPPFTGNTPLEIIIKVLQTETVPLNKYRPDLSARTLKIIELMMRKDPAERPADPETLEEMVTGNVRIWHRGLLRRTGKFLRKRWYWFAIVAVLAVGFTAVRLIVGSSADKRKAPAVSTPRGGTATPEPPRSETGNASDRRDAGSPKTSDGWAAPPPGNGWYVRYEDAQARTAPDRRMLVLWIATNVYMRNQFPFVRKFEKSNDFILRHFIPVYLVAPAHRNVFYQSQMFQKLSERIGIPAEQLTYNCETLDHLGFPAMPTARCPGVMAIFDSQGKLKTMKPIPTSEAEFLTELQKFQSGSAASADTSAAASAAPPQPVGERVKTSPPVKSVTNTPVPPPDAKNSPGSIEARISHVEKRLAELKKELTLQRGDQTRLNKKIELRTKQLRRLREQLAVRNHKPVDSSGFDAARMENFKKRFAEYTRQRRDWGYNSKDEEFSEWIIQELKSGKISPDIEVVDSTYPEFSGPLFKCIMSGRIRYPDKIARELIRLGADTKFVTNENLRRHGKAFLTLVVEGGYDHMTGLLLPLIKNNPIPENPVMELLMLDHPVNERDKQGNTALHYAANRGSGELVLCLLLLDAEVNAANNMGETPLLLASKSANRRACDLLIQFGADPKIKDLSGASVTDMAVIGRFKIAVSRGQTREVESLLKRGVDPNTRFSDDTTALQTACKRKDFKMAKLLLDNGADPNIKSEGHRYNYPLQIAFENQDINTFTLLLKRGADPNSRTPSGPTILRVVCGDWRHNGKEVTDLPYVEALLSDPRTNLYTEYAYSGNGPQVSILRVAMHNRKSLRFVKAYISKISAFESWDPVVADAVSYDFPDDVIVSLIAKGAGVNAPSIRSNYDSRAKLRKPDTAVTPLYAAVEKKRLSTVRLLLKHGADADWKNPEGKSIHDLPTTRQIKELLNQYKGTK